MPLIIDGKKIAQDIKNGLTKQVVKLKEASIRPPHLAIIIVGDDEASHVYVRGKINACKSVGYDYTILQFASSMSEKKLVKHIEGLNQDVDVDGFIVQLPLPEHISVQTVIESITPEKDVDGFTNQNFGSIGSDHALLLPATPFGIMELIRRYKFETKGKHCVIVGASRLVGTPLSLLMLEDALATVTVCHEFTVNLPKYTGEADILIVAVGKPGLITGEMVKEGAVVIDVGSTRAKDSSTKSGFRLSGDVDFDEVSKVASAITPVPGGVGPMTVASLLLNTMSAYEAILK